MTGQMSPHLAAPRSAPGTVRRLIVYTILFVLVVITAVGVSGLLGRLFETRPEFGGIGGLALSLAFALVGGPLAAVTWWLVWRRIADDRSSVAWGIYLMAAYVVALIVATTSILEALASLVAGRFMSDSLATGIVWLGVWIWHRWMLHHPTKSPLRLATVPLTLGAAYGLGVTVVGAIRALEDLFDALVASGAGIPALGMSWWIGALGAVIWFAGGALIWWWHWIHDAVRNLADGFADVMLLLTGVLAAGAIALGGLIAALSVGLRAAFDRSDPWNALIDPLPLGIAAAGVGGIVWLYHRRVARERSESTRSATRLVEAGLGLVAAASGLGVVVNAILAALGASLAGTGAAALLCGGLSALVVGSPVWWLAWRTLHAAPATVSAGRRVYLVVIFGVSAVVALVALLIVGYRVFEYALEGGVNLIEDVRAPFGLLLATGLVAVYHFSVWRRDRAAAPAVDLRTVERVFVVAGGDAAALGGAIEAATGASVVAWQRADTEPGVDAPSPDVVARALDGVHARRVLVVVGAEGALEVIPLVG